MLKLACVTPPTWAEGAAERLDEILLDHAHLEKKAAGTAVTLLFRYPHRLELQQPLACLAREELAHFQEVLAHLERRAIRFGPQRASPYAGRLHALVRSQEPARLLDTLLVAALIEARSCERLGLLGRTLRQRDSALAAFYEGLHAAEARHHALYLKLACSVAPEVQVRARHRELASREAGILRELPETPRVHGGLNGR